MTGEFEYKRYRSRTFWMVIGMSLLSGAFCWYGKVDGTGWLTFMGVLFSGWQIRRFKDNELEIDGGGDK